MPATHASFAAREQLEKLQHRTLPWHFNICIALSGGLLFLWNVGHPHVWENITNSTIVDVAQAYALVTVLTSQLMNRVVFGPMTSKYAQRDPRFTVKKLMKIIGRCPSVTAWRKRRRRRTMSQG